MSFMLHNKAASIGEALRRLYGDTVREPVPQDMKELLEKLK
jgi:hypothetical protein